MFFGLLFVIGKGLIVGVEGNEVTTIPIPQVPELGYAMIVIAIFWALPPWILARGSRILRRILRRNKSTEELSRRLDK